MVAGSNPAGPTKVAASTMQKLNSILEDFVRFLTQKNVSPYTVRNYKSAIERWLLFLEKTKQEVFFHDTDVLKHYLNRRRLEIGKRTLGNELSGLKTFFRFLEKKGVTIKPLNTLITPKCEKKLPSFFTIEQVTGLLKAPDKMFSEGLLSEFVWARDKAILELLYGCGLRVSELVSLTNDKIFWAEGILKVKGKGNKERLSPIGQPALSALTCLCQRLPGCEKGANHLFLSSKKTPLTTRSVQLLVKKYLAYAKLPLSATPHSFRHTYATHLLNANADLRSVQELLGHKNLSTTQIYTHLSIGHLQNIHNKYHPRA